MGGTCQIAPDTGQQPGRPRLGPYAPLPLGPRSSELSDGPLQHVYTANQASNLPRSQSFPPPHCEPIREGWPLPSELRALGLCRGQEGRGGARGGRAATPARDQPGWHSAHTCRPHRLTVVVIQRRPEIILCKSVLYPIPSQRPFRGGCAAQCGQCHAGRVTQGAVLSRLAHPPTGHLGHTCCLVLGSLLFNR